jgi:hypothetical protein
MILEPDTTTKEVLAMYAVWIVFIVALLMFLYKKNSG